MSSAVVMTQPQFLELLASGGEGSKALDAIGITADDLPIFPAFPADETSRHEHLLAAAVAAATETLQIIAPVGPIPSVFAFRDEQSCAVFLVAEGDTTAMNCSVGEAAEILDGVVHELTKLDTDWSVRWHSDGATHQIYVNPDGTIEGDSNVSLTELLAAFSA